ncbi:hypothetical protein BV898_00630 [Hypsibius exemplaris]|uniref:Uncharacterized protein n=1 Tax=Hypsibius exemplaris TaxID=2072580 RepID=A0A1W0XE03_HYPEX|nr:hypothetical protein BV898_00630 [Hypsibius exemplaris]
MVTAEIWKLSGDSRKISYPPLAMEVSGRGNNHWAQAIYAATVYDDKTGGGTLPAIIKCNRLLRGLILEHKSWFAVWLPGGVWNGWTDGS